jgi:hypothetical protein
MFRVHHKSTSRIVWLLCITMVFVSYRPLYADQSKSGQFTQGLGGNLWWKCWWDAGFKGSSTLTRAEDASWCQFQWNAPNYGLLPRVGKTSLYNNAWAVKVDATLPELWAQFDMTYNDNGKAAGDRIWAGIYGWTDSTQAPVWPYKTEFYIIEKWWHSAPNPANLTWKGDFDIDGAKYSIFRSTTPAGLDQWISVRKSPRMAGWVDVKKHLAKWRSLGMANDFIVEVSWAAEIFGKSSGTLRYNKWSIPNLK